MRPAGGGSLQTRLTLAVGAILAVFLALAGIALERAFRQSVDAGMRHSLEARVYLLLGAAEVDADGTLAMPATLAEPRLATPDSGLYAAIRDKRGRMLWRSESSLGRDIAWPAAQRPGKPVHALIDGADGRTLHALAWPIDWELANGDSRRLDILVAERHSAAELRIAEFRRTLWGWFAAVLVALLAVLGALLRWGLTPLRRAAREVAGIEAGERERLGGGYPPELQPLTANLNALLAGSTARLQRYREALAELAHSLKTPLAVLRAGYSDPRVQEQAGRMQRAIDWHLRRAAAAGHSGLAQRVELKTAINRVAGALATVHADKPVTLERDIAPGTVFHGDPEDLVELLGNLLDNAWKWSATRVRLQALAQADGGLRVEIADDGPGLPAERRNAVLERGVRADERVPGEGIGLHLVRSMVEEAYGGTIALDEADLGGLRVVVTLPGPGPVRRRGQTRVGG
mgnify:CR=1 FL=1